MAANNIFDSLNFNPNNLKSQQDKAAEVQNQMAAAQQMIASIEVEGIAGIENYNVKVCLNGRHEAVRVTIDPQLLTQPAQVICDLVAAAITDGAHKVESAIQTKMLDLFKNLKMPG